jgi:hypothetical protein
MDKRYQIFISSTFRDLIIERQAVLKAILELDHMPAGMELFPAADESAWQLIKDVIDASDYYVLIIGGRYGSLDETGISYTEKEYEHAVATKKSVIPLLHENPDNLPRDKTDIDEASWKKLKSFRSKVEKRHTCVYWNSSEDLKAKMIVGLTAAMKRSPAVGWVRANQIPTEATVVEILTLRKTVADLEAEAAANRTRPPKGTEDLVQGDDIFEIHFSFDAHKVTASYPYHPDDTTYTATIVPTWDEIFAAVAPSMINETSDSDLYDSFRTFFESKARLAFRKDRDLKGKTLRNFKFRRDEIETSIVQFRALGLIRESLRQRSVKDTNTYWTLTPYGDQLMIQLRAIRRNPISDEDEAEDLSKEEVETKGAT